MGVYGGPEIQLNNLVGYIDAQNTDSLVTGATVWRDLLNTTYSASLVNTPTIVPASPTSGSHVSYDGINEYSRFNSNFGITTWPFTISCWVYVETGQVFQFGDLVNTAAAYKGVNFLIDGPGNQIVFHYGDGLGTGAGNRYSFTNTSFRDFDKWIHFTVIGKTSISTVPIVYINGSLSPLSYASGTAASVQFATAIYYLNVQTLATTPTYRKSKIAMLQVYNKELTQAEVVQNYNATKSRFGY